MSDTDWILVLVLQVLLVLPLIWQIGRFLGDPRELFSPLTVVAGGFVGLYVLSFHLVDAGDRDAFLTVAGYESLLVAAVLAAGGFWTGFVLGCAGAAPRARPCHEPSLRGYAVALVALGFVAQAAFIHRSGGFLAFYGAPHGAAGAWAETSAYLYALSSFMFPAMCLLWALWVRRGELGPLPRTAFLAALLYAAFEAFVFGNRSDTIHLFLLLLLPPLFLPGRLRLGRPAILLATTVALAAVLLFPQLREDLHLGAERSLTEAVRALLVEDAAGRDHAEVTGHELFYAAAVVEAASAAGTYHYGYAWLYPFVNLVPRPWWPDKPYGSEWSISRPELVQDHAGWRVAGGAATTGVADAYLGFSWLSVLVWSVFGWWGGLIWRRATTTDSVIDVAALWAFLVMAVYFVTQSYGAAWHAWLFGLVPIRLLSFLMASLAAPPARGRAALAAAAAPARGLPGPVP